VQNYDFNQVASVTNITKAKRNQAGKQGAELILTGAIHSHNNIMAERWVTMSTRSIENTVPS
jgi:hypothetical protein